MSRARRLRELLLFLGERTVAVPAEAPSEQDIAVRVFGRTSDFDPTADTLVRVQVSQLRRKLLLYFATEGANEPVIIELPKGSYLPVFIPRDPAASMAGRRAPPPALDTPPFAPREPAAASRAISIVLGVLLAATLAVAVNQYRDSRALARRLDEGEPRPAAHALWEQMAGGRPTQIVVADSTLALFQDMVRYQLSLPEYQNAQFNSVSDKRLETEAERYMARRLMVRQFTSVADARLAQRLSTLALRHGSTEVQHPRQVQLQHFQGRRNVVLSGPRRANPWLALFEDRLNFRTRFDEATRLVSLTNTAPQAGEEPAYAASWTAGGYCRVAFLPNLDKMGSVLIVSGTDMPSTDAGVELLTRDRWVNVLRDRLGLRDGRPLQYFEILLRTRRVNEAAPDFDVVTHRVLEP